MPRRRRDDSNVQHEDGSERGTRRSQRRRVPTLAEKGTTSVDDPHQSIESENDGIERIHEDDLCPICHLLIHDPVTTRCNHTLCRLCMAAWADASLSQSVAIVPLSDQVEDLDAASGMEARCPMCRTHTAATGDSARRQQLQETYPETSAARSSEEKPLAEETTSSIQNVTLHIGNSHRLVPPLEGSPQNVHEWTSFVRPSRTDIIEEVQIFLHPSFRPNRVIRQRPPYEIRRTGWGIFEIEASIILKSGFAWLSPNAEDSPDGAEDGMLRMDWMLTFDAYDGAGAMGRYRLKVKDDRDWEDVLEEEERDRADWARAVRQYQRDGNYEPPPEE